LKHLKPDCYRREYQVFIIHRFSDGEILLEVRCSDCGATIKGRIHQDNFIEVIK